jgi:RNA polymerase sigma factor, sigma-70 family
MLTDEFLQHYGYLSRLAGSKCATQPDADDLVSDTYLAALAFMRRGGVIEHPKTWLVNTLFHIWNSGLRRKYRQPMIVNLDTLRGLADDDPDEVCDPVESAELRRELLYLARITREVLISYYYGNQSVAQIAASLGIPEGTVKSRLSAGRKQIKKGLTMTEEKNNYIPGRLYVSNGGSGGKNFTPMSLVDGDLIAQNLLVLAYDKPLTLLELARAIGIPTVYIEPIIDKLVDGELMAKTDGGKVYTDFIIYKPEDFPARFDAQLDFVYEHFDAFWSAMSEVISGVGTLDAAHELRPRQLKKLERYAVMRMLQNFESDGSGEIYNRSKLKLNPVRRDGGWWTANGNYCPAVYDKEMANRLQNYTVLGGHRTSIGERMYHDVKYHFTLFEFDTTMFDTCRYGLCGMENYFFGIIDLLWYVYNGDPPESAGVNNALIESLPGLEDAGLFTHINGVLKVDIPVLDWASYEQVVSITDKARERLTSEIGAAYLEYMHGVQIKIPPHLTSVPELWLYEPSIQFIVMGAVREVYGRGLHLNDVDYCCPPVVLAYKE